MAVVGAGPDLIAFAPASALADVPSRYEHNPRPRSLSRPALAEATDFYAGHGRFLVRTVLLRAEGWSEDATAPFIRSSVAAARLCGHLAHSDVEYLVCIAMNPVGRLIAIHEAAVGGVEQATATTHQLIKVAMLCSARSMIMVHNHPSGDVQPSPSDVRFTAKIKKALDCVDVNFADHIIVGPKAGAVDVHYASFADMGLLDGIDKFA